MMYMYQSQYTMTYQDQCFGRQGFGLDLNIQASQNSAAIGLNSLNLKWIYELTYNKILYFSKSNVGL